ncbi:hypothetical protein BAR24_00595 [Gluconobacter oxydans]|uniref:restriction endonuclease subunit S n=1 Tax=Gluconobacter thailandicus TaxID=257438 RepID=UPI00037B0B97|nr:restriction endonuclease subunit S [Gluconobacter thailandicus]ANQ40092.1 hypothetical protein BAR24_00595 [Gluconobacter oxydans]
MSSSTTKRLTTRLRFPEFRDVPNWYERKLGDIFGERSEKGFPDKTVLSATQDKGVIPYNLLEKSVIRDNQNLVGYKLVRQGDFVISLRSFEGGFEYSEYEGIISPAYVILFNKEDINKDFFKHLFKSDFFISSIVGLLNNNLRDGKSISYNQAKTLNLLVPGMDEQRAVADCINSVNELIAAESEKLEALKDQKRGLMQQLFPVASEN